MNKTLILFGIASLSFIIGKPQQKAVEFFPKKILSDSLPDICTVLTAGDISKLSPFTIPLSKSYAEEPLEGYRSCIYEFFKPNDYGTIKVSVTKNKSKAEALAFYNRNVTDHIEMWQRRPETIKGLADSAYFNYNAFDDTKCDDCHLLLLSGVYDIIVSFHGQYDDVSRESKKNAAINIVKLLYNRIPGLLEQNNISFKMRKTIEENIQTGKLQAMIDK
jgi:hypothetical protein